MAKKNGKDPIPQEIVDLQHRLTGLENERVLENQRMARTIDQINRMFRKFDERYKVLRKLIDQIIVKG